MNSVTGLIVVLLLSLQPLVAQGKPATNENLFTRYRTEVVDQDLSSDDVSAMNRTTLESLTKSTATDSKRSSWISRAQAQSLVDKMINHQVVGDATEPLYDPTGCIGFCFGRAFYAHLELLARGVSKDSIRKIFVVGPLFHEGRSWDFHVATIVRGPGRTWWVIDAAPWSNGLMTLDEWAPLQETFGLDGRARLYVSDATRYSPSEATATSKQLSNAAYNGYFSDLLQFFRERTLSSDRKLTRCEAAFAHL